MRSILYCTYHQGSSDGRILKNLNRVKPSKNVCKAAASNCFAASSKFEYFTLYSHHFHALIQLFFVLTSISPRKTLYPGQNLTYPQIHPHF